ncbi:9423_t:CDS:2 [Funneliformis caledonium]|uniref:9423_t:CDS:1 n=1 Tax=Funneliformis caledonium TaxID=1117310 RepID=A0A9N8Z0W4_9GLOM|nr:9423_t:CDS:2 [Funneliformis caledonium]
MFAVTDNAGKCHLIGIDQTASYEKFQDRAIHGQKFRSDYDDYEEYTFDEERRVLINVNSGTPQNSSIPREVVNWGGAPYPKQTTQSHLKAISTGIPEVQEWQEDNWKRDILVEEVEEIKYGSLVKHLMDKKDVTKRRRRIIIEDEYEYVDPVLLDETSFPLQDDSDDEDYIPGLSDREGTPDSTEEIDFMEIDTIPISVVNSPDLDSDYGVKTRRQKKAEKKAQKDRRFAAGGVSSTNHKNKKKRKRSRVELSDGENDEYVEPSNDYGIAGPSSRPLRRVKRRINYGESETTSSEEDSFIENDHASFDTSSRRARTPKSPSGSEYQEDSEQEESQNNIDSPYVVSSSQHEVSPCEDTHGNYGGDDESFMEDDLEQDYEKLGGSGGSEQVRATLSDSMDTAYPEDDTRPEWIKMIRPQASPYHPQIGDVIIYFINGHKEMLRRCYHDADNSVLLQTLGPGDPTLHKDHAWNRSSTYKKAIDNILYCLIDDVEWTRGDKNKPFVKITAKTLNLQDYQNNNQLLPIDPVLGIDEKVFATYDNTPYSGTIVQINKDKTANDWSPWQTYTVNWDEPNDPENTQDTLHSWELKRENEQDLVDSKTYGEEDKMTMSNIISELINEVDFDWFVNHVNFTEIIDYLPKIPYPMCLRMIEARIQNNWYRSLRAIKADIDLIHWNATNYNESGTEIPLAANKLLNQFKRLTERYYIYKKIQEELPSYIKSIKK